ncbi:MAG: zinc ribbon domain-containing protein [Spirochaetes bacterium]|nr:zinc ribbon domain-containing protein [Spirochaetota bacterium]
MPVYEFKCNKCGLLFSKIRKIGEFNSPECPDCGSNLTEKVFSLFSGTKTGGSCSPSGGG